MFCCPGDAVPPPTRKSQVLVRVLRVIFVLELLICLPKAVFSVWNFLIELVGCVYLYYAYNQLNYCNCVVYIFFCMMNIVDLLRVFGNLIQENVELITVEPQYLIILIDSALSFVLYVVSIYFAFQSYREFKGIALDIIKVSSSDGGFSLRNQQKDINFQKNLVVEMKTPQKDLDYERE